MEQGKKPIDDCTTCVFANDCKVSLQHNLEMGKDVTIEDICNGYRDFKKRLTSFEKTIAERGVAFALLRLDAEMQEFFTSVNGTINQLIHIIAFMQSAGKQAGPILDPKELN